MNWDSTSKASISDRLGGNAHEFLGHVAVRTQSACILNALLMHIFVRFDDSAVYACPENRLFRKERWAYPLSFPKTFTVASPYLNRTDSAKTHTAIVAWNRPRSTDAFCVVQAGSRSNWLSLARSTVKKVESTLSEIQWHVFNHQQFKTFRDEKYKSEYLSVVQ